MNSDPIVILAARRTPVGAFQGVLGSKSAPELGAAAIRAALAEARIEPAEVDEVLMGCVLAAGLGQAPARQAALGAGLGTATAATTINKMCGSGMRAVMMAADQLLAGASSGGANFGGTSSGGAKPGGVIVAGGFESMSNAPYLLPKARAGYRMGHQQALDHMLFDGLQSPWDGQLMGCFADATAEKYGFTRTHQDEFAAESLRRARAACESGAFDGELTAVAVKTRAGETSVARDETPFALDIAKIPSLKPAFKKDGSVTAASSSGISDGAAALVLMRESAARARGLEPIARITGYASFAREPEWFTLAPVGAIERLLRRLDWRADAVDLYEINEAFAVVTMAAIRDLALDPARVNVNGGACALGHPIGATGARIVTTLIHALRARGLKRGVAALCIGGGEATAVAVEIV